MQTGFALPQAHALFARSAFRYGSPSPPSNPRIPLLRQYVSSSLLPSLSNRGDSALATPCNRFFAEKIGWECVIRLNSSSLSVRPPASLAFTDCATKVLIIKITNDMIKGLRQHRIGPLGQRKKLFTSRLVSALLGLALVAYPCALAPHALAFVHFLSPGLG